MDGDVQNFKTVQKKSEYRIVVDRTAQTATVYHNDEAVKTFPVCTGTTGKHETDLGTFYIYLKYQIQDMTGLNDDGSRYLSKGVKWVSYFYGGEASTRQAGTITASPTATRRTTAPTAA